MLKSLFLCALIFSFMANGVLAANSDLRVVDVQKVITSSKAAEAGRKHLAEARKILEQGYADLQKAWENHPEQERTAAVADGLRALNRQMAMEEQAVTNVINNMMQEQIVQWRKTGNAGVVAPKQIFFDTDPALDITDVIIEAMNKQEPKFSDLPKVSVNTPPAPKKEAPAKAKPAKQKTTGR